MINVTYSEAKLSNLEEITSLFERTIRTVNKNDYSTKEIDAWAKGAQVTVNWINRIETHYFILAKLEDILVGMASITDDGYLDVLFVHTDYQGRGLASSLLSKIKERAIEKGNTVMSSDVSITAKPFFLYKGFEIVRPQLVLCRGVVLRNYHVKLEL